MSNVNDISKLLATAIRSHGLRTELPKVLPPIATTFFSGAGRAIPPVRTKDIIPATSNIKFSPILIPNENLGEVDKFTDHVSTFKMLGKSPMGYAGLLSAIMGTQYSMILKTLEFDGVMGNEYPVFTALSLLGYNYYFLKLLLKGITTSFQHSALKYSSFYQPAFNLTLKHHMPEIKLAENGNCYGYVLSWHQCQLNGINFVEELNHISTALRTNQKLTLLQRNIIKNISKLQSDHAESSSESPFLLDKYGFKFGTTLPFIRQRIVHLSITHAVENPEKLVLLTPFFKDKAHVIGVVADKAGGVKYFDPNQGEAIFSDAARAQIGLSQLLAYEYGRDHPHLGFFKGELPEEVASSPPSPSPFK